MSEFWLKVGKTLQYHRRNLARAGHSLWWKINRPVIKNPIFILGCSRAGTTLVYKTFSQSREVGSLQRETHDFWMDLHPLAEKNWDTHGLTAQDASQGDREAISRYFYTHTGKQRFVDKNNQNGLCVPYLYALYPDAHFVFVKRSPGDNLNSLIEGWGKADEFATWSDHLPEKVAVEGGRYTRWCFFLAEGWRTYLNAPIEEVCAFQYKVVNQAILDGRKIVPDSQWTEIFYEDLVKDPVDGFRRAFAACGLAFTPALAAHCVDVLSTPYNAFSEIRLDKWRDSHNRERIERAMPTVITVTRDMGYEV